MSLSIFIAILCAALLHASWNALVKNSSDKIQGMLVLTLTHGCLGVVIACFVEIPKIEAWPWLLASVLFHVIYQCLLALAYNHGSLSRVYPIARGTAPLIVLLVSFLFLEDILVTMEILGILILGLGIFGMAQGVFSNHESLKLLPYAFGSAIATAGYTLSDGIGARISEHATSYIAWLFILTVPVFIPLAILLKGFIVMKIPLKTWRVGSAAGVFSFLSYWVAIWAMTKASIPLVAALRETSILFAVLIGTFIFKEKITKQKTIAALFIVSGLVVMRL